MMLWTGAGLLAHEIVMAALVGAGFLTVFVTAEVWKRTAAPPVEWTRKFVHFFGGLIAASFPWLFLSRWTVVALAAGFTLLLWGTRRLGLLGSVHGVERKSEGGIFFPLGVLAVFLVGHDRPVLYLVAILALVVSDTAAALLGSSYGRQIYTVEQDRRSIEGSAVFFLTTFLITHIPLLLMARLDPLLSVLIALQVAIIVTQFEAISLHGSDNLLVPIATFYLLLKMTPRDADHIAGQLAAQLTIIAVIGIIAWRTRPLTFSGAMVLMLFAYGVWGLGGEEWIVAPAMGLLGFIVVRRLYTREVPTPPGHYQVVALFYTCIVATILFIANNTLETLVPTAPPVLRWYDPFYLPYVAVVSAQVALIFIAQLEPFDDVARDAPARAARPARPARPARIVAAAAAAFALVAPPALAVGPRGLTPSDLLIAAAATAAASLLYLLGRRSPRWPRASPWNVRLQAASTAAVAALLVPMELWRLLR
jgi:dolichol kinase